MPAALPINAIADALVYAVTYINCRAASEEDGADDDVGALESIAAYLQHATDEEKDALAAAAIRAAEAERRRPGRDDFIRAYSSWMEDMFGDEEWNGNRRC